MDIAFEQSIPNARFMFHQLRHNRSNHMILTLAMATHTMADQQLSARDGGERGSMAVNSSGPYGHTSLFTRFVSFATSLLSLWFI